MRFSHRSAGTYVGGMQFRGIANTIVILVIALSLVAATSKSAAGQQYGVESSAFPESLTVGDRFLYVNRVESFTGISIEPLPPGEKLGEAFVLSRIFEVEDSVEDAVSYACTLAVYQPGRVEIPTFSFLVTDTSGVSREIEGQPLTLEINSVLPPDTTGLEIADIREPYRLRGPIWPYLAVALAVVLLIAGLVWLRKNLGGRVAVPNAPPRPPWEVAFERLDILRQERHLEFGRLKQYYSELSLIFRSYLEGRYSFPAVECTTRELENVSDLKTVQEKLYRRLFDFFWRADLAKFAKLNPPRHEAESDLSFAFEFVRETIPVVSPKSEKEGALGKDVSI